LTRQPRCGIIIQETCMILYLIKPGELVLKGGNRKAFEYTLRRNLAALLRGGGAQIRLTQGRFFVSSPEETAPRVEECLDHLIGIAGWAQARIAPKTVEGVIGACIAEARGFIERGVGSFKIEARRTDKSFPLSSYEICCAGGTEICRLIPGLRVDVQHPEGIIQVEIRERAYIYGINHRGRRGLPVGTGGRGLLLLSGGIDSPVAGYLMITRGMRLDGAYFHAYPYTSEEARQKAIRLAEILGRYSLGMPLFVIPFAPLQARIRERAPEAWRTVLLRMAMMDAAEQLARSRKDKCLVTGESLSQVASQTIENLTCTGSRIHLPILRPLVGLDKEEIVDRAKALGTYGISILPYQDCCVLFSPPHPVLRAQVSEAGALYEALEADSLIQESLHTAETVRCGYSRST